MRLLKAAPVLLLIWAAHAQEIKKVPIQRTPAADGQQMFTTYCAVCHGKEGRGDGPAANALKKRPADLTQLARKHDGKFPEMEVMNFITGNDVIAAHGSRTMPVWGDLFHALSPNDHEVVQIRVNNLTDYVKSIQAQ
jgi:mono/diheme cytochrome c family protein